MIAGTLEIKLMADMARLQRDMDEARRSVSGAMASIERSVGVAKSAFVGLVSGFAGAFTIGAFVGKINDAVDALAKLDDMAQKTGSSVENLSKLQKVADAFSQDFGIVDASLDKLAKGMAAVDDESNKTQQALKALGVSSVDEFGKMRDTSEVMIDVAKALQNYKDDASKAAVMTDAFGKSGADLIPYMNDLAENVDAFGTSSAEASRQASELQDKLGMTRVKVNDLFEKMSIALLPTMIDVIDALTDTGREAGNLSNDSNLTGWADNLAESVATAADYVNNLMILMRGAGQIAGEVAAKADIKSRAASERGSALEGVSSWRLWTGAIPDDVQKRLDAINAQERAAMNAVTAAGNTDRDGLVSGVGRFGRALNERRAGRQADRESAAMAEFLGSGSGVSDTRNGLSYGGRTGGAGSKGGAGKSEAQKLAEDGDRFVAKLKEEAETFGLAGAALARYQAQKSGYSAQVQEEAAAYAAQIEALKAAEVAKREQEAKDKQAAAQRAADLERNAANVQNIRFGLMTDLEQEQEAHALRLEELKKFHDARVENEMQANLLIEAEKDRHAQVAFELQARREQETLYMYSDSADQLYGLMKQAGLEKTALGKMLFLASKALAIQEIILNTEVAASKAGAQLGIFGIPMATMIRAMGYASAGLVAGMAVAEVSAEGGYDIPAGVNPVVQTHQREMILPAEHADTIRNLGKGGGEKITIVNQTTGRIDKVTEQRISPTERALIIQEAVATTAAQFSDPNSQTSRSLNRNFSVPRSR